MQKSSKIFFLAFFTPFDRVRAADHEYLLFSLSKYFIQVEKYEIVRGCRFCKKAYLFRNIQKLLLYYLFQLLKILFSDSASKTESGKILKSISHLKLYW